MYGKEGQWQITIFVLDQASRCGLFAPSIVGPTKLVDFFADRSSQKFPRLKLFPALKSKIFLQIFPPDVSSRHKTTKRLGTSMSIFGRMVIRVSSAVYAPFSGTLLTVLAVLCCYMTVCKTKIVGQLWMESQPILRSGPSTRSLRRYVISTMKTWLRNSQVCFDLVHLSFVKRSLKR